MIPWRRWRSWPEPAGRRGVPSAEAWVTVWLTAPSWHPRCGLLPCTVPLCICRMAVTSTCSSIRVSMATCVLPACYRCRPPCLVLGVTPGHGTMWCDALAAFSADSRPHQACRPWLPGCKSGVELLAGAESGEGAQQKGLLRLWGLWGRGVMRWSCWLDCGKTRTALLNSWLSVSRMAATLL